ncbi:hypothetical protein ACQ4PT_062635 [Festuca glaucescens]
MLNLMHDLKVILLNQVTPGTNVLHDVYKLELSFHLESNNIIACSLDLTNNTDEHVAFGLLNTSDEQTSFLSSLPLFGIVDPGTIYTVVVIMNRDEYQPQERSIDLILQTSVYYKILRAPPMLMLQNAEEVTLESACALPGETTFEESTRPSLKIISMKDNYSVQHICSIDANGTEPLIITGHLFGYVHIWNYATQASYCLLCQQLVHINYVLIAKYWEKLRLDILIRWMILLTAVCSVKFIAGKQWFLAGSCDGFIHVYNYKNGMQKMGSLKAHDIYLNSLAIHPTELYVLSVCTTEIKLWALNGSQIGFKYIQTIEASTYKIRAVAFNPNDNNTFASACHDGTIEVGCFDSVRSQYTMSGHSGCVESLDFFTRDGQQYLITGSYDKTAKIWDMHKKECVGTLLHRSEVLSVLPYSKLGLLVTGTADGDVYFWSSTNFRLKRIVNIGGNSRVRGLACLIEYGRVAISHQKRVSVIEIHDEEEQVAGEDNDENSY